MEEGDGPHDNAANKTAAEGMPMCGGGESRLESIESPRISWTRSPPAPTLSAAPPARPPARPTGPAAASCCRPGPVQLVRPPPPPKNAPRPRRRRRAAPCRMSCPHTQGDGAFGRRPLRLAASRGHGSRVAPGVMLR